MAHVRWHFGYAWAEIEFGNSCVDEQKGFKGWWTSSISDATSNVLFLLYLQGLSSPRSVAGVGLTDGRSSNRNGGCQLTNDTTHDCRRASEYAVETVSFLLSAVRQCPHITLPLPPGPRKSYSNPRIPGGICSIHESEIPGRRAKGTFERICGIRSRHPMSHCPVVTSSPLRQPALLFLPFRDHVPNATRVKDRPANAQTAFVYPRHYQPFSLISPRNRLVPSRLVPSQPVSFRRSSRESRIDRSIGPRKRRVRRP